MRHNPRVGLRLEVDSETSVARPEIVDILLGRSCSQTDTAIFKDASPEWIPQISWVEQLLSIGGLPAASLRVVREGVTLDRSGYQARTRLNGTAVDGLIDRNGVREQLNSGNTLVLDDVGLWDPQISAICNASFVHVWQYANASYFITPGNQHGLPFHADSELTVVFQIAGTKRWDVIERKASTQGSLEGHPITQDPYRQFDLKPGDVLVVPSLFPHRTQSLGDSPSVHLTLGLRPFRLSDLVPHMFAQSGARLDSPSGALVSPSSSFGVLRDSVENLAAGSWAVAAAKASIEIQTGGRFADPSFAALSEAVYTPPLWTAPVGDDAICLAGRRMFTLTGNKARQVRELARKNAVHRLVTGREILRESLSADDQSLLVELRL